MRLNICTNQIIIWRKQSRGAKKKKKWIKKKAPDKQTCAQWLLDQWQMKNSHECSFFVAITCISTWIPYICMLVCSFALLILNDVIVVWITENVFHFHLNGFSTNSMLDAHILCAKMQLKFLSEKKVKRIETEWVKGVCENESFIQLMLTKEKTCHVYMGCIKIVLRRIVRQATKWENSELQCGNSQAPCYSKSASFQIRVIFSTTKLCAPQIILLLFVFMTILFYPNCI